MASCSISLPSDILSANFIHNFQRKPHVPVHQDIFNHPVSRLPSRQQTWSIDTSSSTEDLWRAAWETDDLPANSEIIDDSPNCSRAWCQPPQARVMHSEPFPLRRWPMCSQSPSDNRTVRLWSHPVIVDSCLAYKFKRGLASLHTASDSAVEWLHHSCIR